MAGPSGAPPSRTYGLGAGVRVDTVSSSGAERRARGIADGFLEVAGIRRPWDRRELINREGTGHSVVTEIQNSRIAVTFDTASRMSALSPACGAITPAHGKFLVYLPL